jgi:hypothetical protein
VENPVHLLSEEEGDEAAEREAAREAARDALDDDDEEEDEMNDFIVDEEDEMDEMGNVIKRREKKKRQSSVQGVSGYALSEAQEIFGDTTDLLDMYHERKKQREQIEADLSQDTEVIHVTS